MSKIINDKNIRWKTEYSVGNMQIDKEHQGLFLLAKKILSITILDNEEEIKKQLLELIPNLYKSVKNHFINEQTYMEKIKYPELENHIKLHTKLLDILTNLIRKLNTLEIKEIENQLYIFIDEYIIKHIIIEDKKIYIWNTPIKTLKKSFGWKDVYKVGNEQIDKEHKQLFDIASEAFIEVDSASRTKKIKLIIGKLYTYIKMHFEHEEEFMSTLKYPRLEDHKKLHDDIINQMNGFIKNIATLNVEVFEKELATLIDILLVQHIIQEDRKIMQWYRKGK